MTVIYRTAGAWGPGKGAGLTPAEIDTNFWTIAQSIAAIESGSLDINSIENIVVSGSTFTIHTTRGDTFGPYSMPVAMMRPRGDWVATYPYSPLDLVSVAGDGLYVVGVAHVADATFDANRLISGEKVYTLVLQPGADGPQGIQGPAGPAGPDGPQGIQGPAGPAGADGAAGSQGPAGADGAGVPTGGAAGQILSKVDGTDFNTEWVDAPSGGSTSGTAHAYWRIKITASNSATYVNLTELELRGSIDGADQASGGTSICGSSYFGGTGTEVWDGNTTSDRWGPEANGVTLGTAWVGYHFAAPVDVKQIAMTCSGWTDEAPTAFNLEWSDDGVTWTVLESFTTASVWTAYETRLFTVQSYLSLLADLDDVDMSTAPTSGQALKWNGTAWAPAADVTGGSGGTSLPTGGATGQVLAKASNTDGDAHWVDAASGGSGSTSIEPHAAHRGWRILILDTIEYPTLDAGGYATIGDLAFYDRSGTQIATSGGITTGFNIHAGFPLANAFDGSSSTVCSSAASLSKDQRMALGYVFATAVDVGSIKLKNADGYANHMPVHFSVQYSDDLGATWKTYAHFTDTGTWSNGEERTYTLGTAGIEVIGGGGGSAETLTRPVTADFTAGPGDTATTHFEDSRDGVRLRDFNVTGNNNLLRYEYQAPAGAHWKATGKFRRSMLTAYVAWGIVLGDAAGKLVLYGPMFYSSTFGRMKFVTYNTFDGGDSFAPEFPADREFWLRVRYDGTYLWYEESIDGDYWTTVWRETATTYLGAVTKVGFGLNLNHGGNDWFEPWIECLSWVNESI